MSGGGIRAAGSRVSAGPASALLGLLVLVVLVVFLAGCGTENSKAADPAAASPTAGANSSAPSAATGLPPCADVWQSGARLPRGYDGCLEGDRAVAPDSRYCEFGKPLVTYDERFYAVPGGRIAEAEEPFATDPAYQRVLASCSG